MVNNSGHLENNDKVVMKLNDAIEIYKTPFKKYQSKSKHLRTLSLISLIWGLLFLSLILYSKLVHGLTEELMSNLGQLTAPISIFLLLICFGRTFKGSKIDIFIFGFGNVLLCLINISTLISPTSEGVVAISSIVNLTIFVSTYLYNRLFGYTSAMVRYQTTLLKIELLRDEYQTTTIGLDAETLGYEQSNTLNRLYQIAELAIDRRDKEILGDHYKVHDSALNWVKGLKK